MVSFKKHLHEEPKFQKNTFWLEKRFPIVLTVISIFMISPSSNGRSSGIPCTATLFTDVQTDFGNIEYRSGDGYAFAAIVSLWTNSSISSVVSPGYAWVVEKENHFFFNLSVRFYKMRMKRHFTLRIVEHFSRMLAANLQLLRIAAIELAILISGFGELNISGPSAMWKYSGLCMWSGTKRSGDTLPGRTILYCPVSVLWIKQINKWKLRKKNAWMSTCVLSIFLESKKLSTIWLIPFGKR